MAITHDLNVQDVLPTENGTFELNIEGRLISMLFIDADRSKLESIGAQITHVIETMEQQPVLPVETSNRPTLQRLTSVREMTEKANADIKSLQGRKTSEMSPLPSVRRADDFAERMAAFQIPKKAPPKNTTTQTEGQARPLFHRADSAQSSVALVSTPSTRQSLVKSTSSERQLPKSSSNQSLTFGRPTEPTREVVNRSTADPEPEPEPEIYNPEIQSKIAAFNVSKRKLPRSDSDRSNEPLLTVTPRKLRNSPFFRSKKEENSREKLEGIGQEELAARRNLFKKKRPEQQEQDGMRDGLSKRNSSLFSEHKRKRPIIYRISYSDSISPVQVIEETDDTCSDTEDGSAFNFSPSNFNRPKLCLPAITSAAHYHNIFLKMFTEQSEVETRILNRAGNHYRTNVSLLERLIHLKLHLNGKGFDSLGDERSITDGIRKYKWAGHDTVDLIEKRLMTEGRVMYQIYNSGKFIEMVSERIFECIPAAVGYSVALSKTSPAPFVPLNYYGDSAVIVSSAQDFDVLLDWAESEMALPTWTGLKAYFDDQSECEFGQSFTVGLHIETDLLEQCSEQASRFFKIQFRKTILDAIYSGYDTVILTLPPAYNNIKIAQEAADEVIEEVEFLLPPDLLIFMPEFTN